MSGLSILPSSHAIPFMINGIKPVHGLTQEHILAPLDSRFECAKEKIQGLFLRIIPALLSGHFFSSKEFYGIAEVALLCSSMIGLIGSLALFITGMPSASILTFTLSMTTAVGAYLGNQASLQQTLIESANQMREQTEILAIENETLKKTVSELSIQISQFDIQLEHLKILNREFQKELIYFQTSNEKNIDAFARKTEDFSTQITAFETLWNQLLKNHGHLNGDLATEIANLKKIIQEITDPKATLVRLEELRKISEQIDAINRQIALKDGQIEARDELLKQSTLRISELLTSFTTQVLVFIQQNCTLKTLVEALKKS